MTLDDLARFFRDVVRLEQLRDAAAIALDATLVRDSDKHVDMTLEKSAVQQPSDVLVAERVAMVVKQPGDQVALETGLLNGRWHPFNSSAVYSDEFALGIDLDDAVRTL